MRNLKENFPASQGSQTNSAAEPKPARTPSGTPDLSADGAWKMHFSLGENVRFTRTPEAELLRRRGEPIPPISWRPQAKPVVDVPAAEVQKMAEAQPMAVAALQDSVAQKLIPTPAAPPVPPVVQAAKPVASAAPAAPIAASVQQTTSTPLSVQAAQAASASPVVPGHAPQAVVVRMPDIAAAEKPAAAEQPVASAFANLSDFAFFEGVDFSTPLEPMPVAATQTVAETPAPAKAAPSVEEILARYRVREWSKVQPASIASAEPVASVAPAAPVEAASPVAAVATHPAPAETPAATQPIAAPQQAAAQASPAPVAEPANETAAEMVAAPAAPATDHDDQAVVATVAPEPVSETVAEPVAEEAPKPQPTIALYQPQPLAQIETPVSRDDYVFPPRDLLQMPAVKEGNVITQEMLERSAGLLESVLEDFGVRGEIIHVRPGPVVTLYEFEPAPGVKSSRVIGLADDIARSMSALSARVAVVPGRNVIGIELPNATRETVYLREMIESRAFVSSNYRLPICLGKGIGGEPIIAELAKMPHLLVAGTTGSGKSVAINTMILSLLYRFKPEECRLIMVDPKMLELSIYDGIPHLLTPVVTDPKKAVVALKWAVREMEERYRKMARLGVRNIEGFNQRAASAKGKGEKVMCTVQSGFDKETGEPIYVQEELDLTPMPYIVVIIDEMADLMMVAGKDIEGAVQRLAQMARAAGIHLIMATQRPSVDVITGTIKANFPTRISFQVTSKIDSRTILGEMGAEQLLGQGDMLHMAGGGRIVRVHGPFVSDEEVEKVVSHLKEQGRPDYLATVTEDEEEEDEAADTAGFDATAMGADDESDIYEQAVKVVMRDKKCSTSYIQRRLGIGYNRAASLVERMEKEGLVGPANHVGKREILAGHRD